MNIKKAMFDLGLVKGYAECRRLITQNAVFVNDTIVDDFNFEVKRNDVIKIGKTNIAIVNVS